MKFRNGYFAFSLLVSAIYAGSAISQEVSISSEGRELVEIDGRVFERLDDMLLEYQGIGPKAVQGWLDGSVLPESFIMWLAEQLAMPDIDRVDYTRRRKTKSEHHQIAMSHLGLRPFQAAHLETATLLAREAAFATDHGQDIMTALF